MSFCTRCEDGGCLVGTCPSLKITYSRTHSNEAEGEKQIIKYTKVKVVLGFLYLINSPRRFFLFKRRLKGEIPKPLCDEYNKIYLLIFEARTEKKKKPQFIGLFPFAF